ncbi:MAG: IS110 family transposase [Myxacorys californica WJT36-NPBG1]|jgi:transposase|nr:IS110 family transposase [Myxacorys californica WJT36-NPBG1]
MKKIHERCCGLDVHKRSVTACLITPVTEGRSAQVTRTFGTTTAELLELVDWLVQAECTIAAMESTGSYWKPVYNLLEGALEVWVVNAHHIKSVPGRKTDVKDAQWIAELLQHGLLRPSFIPSATMRELRELVRYRKSLIQERSAEANRIQKVLEGANTKLASVATDIMGMSGRAILSAIVAGQTNPEEMAELAKGKLRSKLPQLQQALSGTVRPHQRFILAQMLAHVDFLDEALKQCSDEIAERLRPQQADVERLCTIPGVKQKTAELILAEIGTDMSRFPTAKHLASWAGLCPGLCESAGKQYSGKTRNGSVALRSGLVEAALAAGRARNTYLGARYQRLKLRRGSKRAAMAVAHTILVIAYHILSEQTTYRELGSNYLDQQDRDRVSRQLKRHLERLGYQVSLEPTEPETPTPSMA